MVEPSRDYFDMRTLTPTPRQSVQTTTYETHRNEQDTSLSSSSSQVINTASCQPITDSEPRPFTRFIDHSTMDGIRKEAQNSHLPLPDRATGETTAQAHSESHSGQLPYPTFQTTSLNARPAPQPSRFMHGTTALHRHPSTRLYYGQGSGYNQPVFSVPTQPASNTTPFAAYPAPPGSRATPQNPHIRYQPMMQPHALYYPHPASTQIPNHFQSVRYQPPLSPQFTYPPQPFPSPPNVYHPYPSHQHYVSSEGELQGAWYYVPHAVPQHAEGSPIPYPGHYPNSYPSTGVPDMEITNSPSSAQQISATHPWSGSQGSLRKPESSPSGRLRTTPPKQPTGAPPPSQSDTEPVEEGSGVNTIAPSFDRRQEKPLMRKSYHPNPPPDRSEWAMWVGNIPSDATRDELWKFFSQPVIETPTGNPPPTPIDQTPDNGVTSIFLISKSSCVFVNFRGEGHLARAIERFNGKLLRPHDPRSPKLVCRIRGRDDDLKAGVGGQRGQGLHVRWVRDQKFRGKQMQSEAPLSSGSPYSQASGLNTPEGTDYLSAEASGLTLSDGAESKRDVQPRHRSSSGSFASTDSGLLSNFFPKRYFILKSLTQYDLDISVQQGLWATQKHNEGILDRAYRTSNEVFLIFGVNKSGEFYGYARMAGAVQHGERTVPWASRTKEVAHARRHAHQSSQHNANTTFALPKDRTPPPPEAPSALGAFSPTDSAPPGGGGTPDANRYLSSAPGQVERYSQLSVATTAAKSMTMPATEFELDPQAPFRAMRVEASPSEVQPESPSPFVPEDEQHHIEGDIDIETGSQDEQETNWGDCFKVEWLCTERLPFYWTRSLRNPWNHDREVKISRDGTELEPSVGERLLNAWQIMREEGGEVPSAYSGQNHIARKGGHTRRQNSGGKQTSDLPSRGPMRS